MSKSMDDPNVTATKTLVELAKELGFETRTTSSSVFQTILPSTISFSTIETWLKSCKDVAATLKTKIEVALVSQKNELMFATRIGKKRARDDDDNVPTQTELDDVQDRVESLIKKVEKSAQKDTLNTSEIEVAKDVLHRAMLMTGEGRSRLVQSVGLFQKKLATTDPRPRLVLALRLHAGVPVLLNVIKTSMGACFVDGAITLNDAVHGVDSVTLPLSEEGKASKDFGNLPILFVTSVPPAK